jgi:gliding motility-associated-like protein
MRDSFVSVVSRMFFGMLLITGSFAAFSQNLSQHNWYFGNSPNGIRFNRADNIATLITNKAIPFGTGGAATATDPGTADLLFYTDGDTVFDASNRQMPAGIGLNGFVRANQPVAICAVPGQTNKYFIFTNTANYTTGGSISRSVIDMGLFGNSVFPAPPLGDLESKNVAVPGLTNVSEGMVIVPHSNGTDFWLITQQNGTQTYFATLINAASYTAGTFTTKTTAGLGFPMSVANFSYFKKLKKLAVSPQTAGVDAIILTFDNTGAAPNAFTFDKSLLNSGPKVTASNQAIYDIQWDNKGQYLYVSRAGDASTPADLLQFDYTNATASPASVLTTPVFRSYGLQIAPDSAIYYLYQATSGGPSLVDKFTKTDTIAAGVIHTPTPLGAVNFAGKQFPSFLPKENVNFKVGFTYSGTCQNNPTTFYPTISPNADSLHWDFGDGKDTTLWSPIHTYLQAQTFNVKLSGYYQGQEKDTTESITITPFALMLTLVQDTTACRCQLPARRKPGETCDLPDFSVTVKVAGGTATSIVWSNGDTGATLKPDSAGYYYVVVSDGSGCSTYAGVNVKEYGLNDMRENVWYFGNKAGINFNVNPAVAMNRSAMNAPAGCSVVSDRNGAAIFYTDGSNVYNKNDSLIATGIGGDPLSTQSALIVPVPGDETLYYIFTTQAINGTSQNQLSYSLFDLKQDSGKGKVVKKDVLLFSKSTERITGDDKWLIAHEYGNNTFRAYPVSSTGIGDPVYSAIGSNHSFAYAQNGEGYMNLGARGLLAVALATPGVSNLIELFHFNDTTGIISDYRKIDLKTTAGQVYGVEISPGGNKIYATVDGMPSPSELFEYSIDSVGNPHLKQTLSEPAELGAIQDAPNGQVYVAVNNSNSLGVITPNEDTTAVSSFQLNGFALAAGTNSRLGLPNFIQHLQNGFGGPSFSFTNVCSGIGDSTHFVGVPTDAIDKFQWFFGDGGSSTASSPAHLYAAAGVYSVSMHLTNRCHLDTTITQKVTVYPAPPKPTVTPASVLCHGPVTLNANTGNLPGTTYLWSNGDTTKIEVVSSPHTLSVTNTDSHGCQSTATAIVADNRPQVNLGANSTVCQNNTVPPLDAQNPGDTYAWTLNGVANGNTSETQSVDVSTPATEKYRVTVTDPVTTCAVSDSVTYIVNVSPSFSLSGTNPTSCNTATGTISLVLNTTVPPGGPYSYFLSGPNGFNQQGIDQNAPSTIGPITGQKAGTFSGVVTDQISGCSFSNSVGLTDASFTASAAAQPPNCEPVVEKITVTAPAVVPLQYTATNSGTGQVTTGSSPTLVFNTAPLSAGTYVIQIVDNNGTGCTYTFNTTVNPGSPVPLTLTPNLCSSPPTLSATPGYTYVWTTDVPGTIVGPTTNATITLLANGGTATFTVTATGGAGTCPATQSTTLNLTGPGTPTFTQSDPCNTQVELTALPVGNYIYRWSLGGVVVAVGQQTIVTTSGTYTLTLADPVSGCQYSSAPQLVSVLGTVTASLTSTQACDDGKPFTLTAATNAPSPTYAWYLNNTLISGATAPTLDQTSGGTYKVEITQATCTASAQLEVLLAPIPVGKLPEAAIICADPANADTLTKRVYLDPGSFASYSWFKDQVNQNYTSEVFKAIAAGTYTVDLTNSFGCTSTDQTQVSDNCEPVVTAPTAFRPGSSVVENQHFSVFTFFIVPDQFQVFIFNRWGEMVYQSSDRNFQWNGAFNNSGPLMPGGTYAYVIKYVSSYQPEQGVKEKHGGVVLVR